MGLKVGMRLTGWILIAGFCLGLTSCYTWDVTDKPVSGVKLVRPDPNSYYLQVGEKYVFSGSVVSESLDSLTVGAYYKPFGYEDYPDSEYVPFNIVQRSFRGIATGLVGDSFIMPANSKPGRYVFFSVARDNQGRYSDTNRSYRYIVPPNVTPYLTSANPAFSETAIQGHKPGDSVLLSYTVRAIQYAGQPNTAVGLDRIVVRLCPVLDSGLGTCQTQRILPFNADTAITSSTLVGLPLTAVVGQRFRTQLIFINRAGYQYTWQPLYQITSL